MFHSTMASQTHTSQSTGFFDDKNNEIIDKKTKLPKSAPDPEWLLFEKCMRGDSSDNVFSAFPKVRTTKLKDAFQDRKVKASYGTTSC